MSNVAGSSLVRSSFSFFDTNYKHSSYNNAHLPLHIYLYTFTYTHLPIHIYLYTFTYTHLPMNLPYTFSIAQTEKYFLTKLLCPECARYKPILAIRIFPHG